MRNASQQGPACRPPCWQAARLAGRQPGWQAARQALHSTALTLPAPPSLAAVVLEWQTMLKQRIITEEVLQELVKRRQE